MARPKRSCRAFATPEKGLIMRHRFAGLPECRRALWIKPMHAAVIVLTTIATMPLVATPGRSLSTFRFVDAETGAAIQPTSVRIGGHEVASSVGDDGVVLVEMDPEDRMVEVHAPGYPTMRVEHRAVAPVSAVYTFEMVAEPRQASIAATVVGKATWVR